MFEEFYDNLEVIDASQADWRDNILKTVGRKEPQTITPFKAILNLAHKLGVKTVVVESNYVDTEFLDEFRTHYCASFRCYSTLCKRIHFFSNSFTKKEVPTLNLAEQGYLGFSIIRPIGSFCTGRTILISPKHDGDTMFTLCKTGFEANLAGNKLSVEGMPFMQQDTNVGVCAQAAIWMASLYMHQKFNFPHFSPSQVTAAATKSLTIGPVRRGLVPEQIVTGLREMGYTPVIFTHYDDEVTSRLIYAYIESELPVIMLLQVGTEGHAVVVVGHDFNYQTYIDPSWESNMHWIDRFYIHDDAVAPYTQMLVRGCVGRERDVSYSVRENARYIVVPVPPAITMQANDVFDHLDTLMERLNDLVDLFGLKAEPFHFSDAELTGIVLRTYLRASNDFKVGLSTGMSELFQHRYKSMCMPRYIWVTEVSKQEYINKPRSQDRKIIGEIIIDSTADRHAHMESYLAIHLLGRMIVKHPNEDEPYALYVDPSEKPYGHLVR
jgi:hypothetical protein